MNKKKVSPVVVLAAIAVTALGLAAAVYAKYVSSITKTGTATVAKWAFVSDNESSTLTCNLDETYDASTLVGGKIAPGTSGYCEVMLSNANTEVGVDYTISLPSTVANKPTNLKFYKDESHNTEMTSSSPITGRLAPKATAATSVKIYWMWPYTDNTDAYDTADTTDGTAANTMTMEFTITGTQVQPTN